MTKQLRGKWSGLVCDGVKPRLGRSCLMRCKISAPGSTCTAGHEAIADCVHPSALVIKSVSKRSGWASGQLLIFGSRD